MILTIFLFVALSFFPFFHFSFLDCLTTIIFYVDQLGRRKKVCGKYGKIILSRLWYYNTLQTTYTSAYYLEQQNQDGYVRILFLLIFKVKIALFNGLICFETRSHTVIQSGLELSSLTCFSF